jgi:hypothetical protein
VNTVHSVAFSGESQGTTMKEWRASPRGETPSLSSELNRMLSAAVVNTNFRRRLLSDPVAALAGGYNGESFEIKAEELAQIVLIRAGSLAEFASQLIDRLWYGRSANETDGLQGKFHAAGSGPVAVKKPVLVLSGPASMGGCVQSTTY